MPSKTISLTEPRAITISGIYTIIYMHSGLGTLIERVNLSDSDLPYLPVDIVPSSVYVVIDHSGEKR